MLDAASGFGVEFTVVADWICTRGGGGCEHGGFETFHLNDARGGDSFPDHCRGLAGYDIRGEFAKLNQRHRNQDVYAVEQRATDLLAVVFDLLDGAAALAFRITVRTARVWVPFSRQPA